MEKSVMSASKAGALLVLLFTAQALCMASTAGSNLVGINYGPALAQSSLSPGKSVALIRSIGVGSVRLLDADTHMLTALANTGLDVVISLESQDIPTVAISRKAALDWVQKNVATFLPYTHITAINIGNDIFSTPGPLPLWKQLLPAMANIHEALHELDLGNIIKVTTSLNMDVLSFSFPPSSGTFRADIALPFIAPILQFLNQTQAPLFLNVFPYLAWLNNPKGISLSFALFNATDMPMWLDNNLAYFNLLDAQLDAIAFAMEKLGYGDIDIVISETGWPLAGARGASPSNARMYNDRLVKKVTESSSVGTPRRPNKEVAAYIYVLLEAGHTVLRWGVFNQNGYNSSPEPSYKSPAAHTHPRLMSYLLVMLAGICLA